MRKTPTYRRENVPIFPNLHADCMRVAMMSVIHHHDPRSDVSTADLAMAGSYAPGTGTDVALAALVFNRLGFKATAFASSLDRIPEQSLALAERYGTDIRCRPTPLAWLQRQLGEDDMLICAVDPAHMYPGAYSASHAVVMTGLMEQPVLRLHHKVRYHETMWRARNDILGTPDRKMPALKFELARAAHDMHTLVVTPGPHVKSLSRLFIGKLRKNADSPLRLCRNEMACGPGRPVSRGAVMVLV